MRTKYISRENYKYFKTVRANNNNKYVDSEVYYEFIERVSVSYEKMEDKTKIPNKDCLYFYCNMTNLSKLPRFQSKSALKVLDCSENIGLCELSNLPHSMEELYCNMCNLTTLPNLPARLKKLDCSKNKLIELPEFPHKLRFIHCAYNNISELPDLPSTIKIIHCNDNPIKFITPDIYTIMKNIYYSDHSSIKYRICLINTIFLNNSGYTNEEELFRKI
jgi:hypothetical protein